MGWFLIVVFIFYFFFIKFINNLLFIRIIGIIGKFIIYFLYCELYFKSKMIGF